MTTTTITCSRGNAAIRTGTLGPQILTGKRRRWDSLHWSLMGTTPDGGMEVSLQGLWRGRYADAKTTARSLHHALTTIEHAKEADDLARACAANGINL